MNLRHFCRVLVALLALALLLPLPARSAPADSRIVGKWRAASGAVLELKADGTGSNARGPFRYTAAEGVLVFKSAEGSRRKTYKLDGTKLIVTAGSERETFTRAVATTQVRAPASGASAARSVVINRTRLADKQVAALEKSSQVRVLDGAYWYDKVCGAWGLEGGPTLGFIRAGLEVGGPLRADASGGHTGVFINGREIHPMDVARLQEITAVVPGRYWVNALGFCGYEGNPVPIMNLAVLAEAARARSGGTYHSRSDITGIGSGGDGKTSYVMGKDWSVISGE